MNVLERFHRYFTGPVPRERLALLRLVTGLFAVGYLLARAPHFVGLASFEARDFRPVGIVSVLGEPVAPPVHYLIYAIAISSGVGFVLGAKYRYTGPLFALTFLWITTYRCSFGMIFHQDNVVALHLVVLAPANAAAVWAYDARGRVLDTNQNRTSGWPVRSMALVTVVSYVLAGIAKLKDWLASGK